MKSEDNDSSYYPDQDVSRRNFLKYIAIASASLFSAASGCCRYITTNPLPTPATSPAPLPAATQAPISQIMVPVQPINLCYSPFRDGQDPTMGPGKCVYPTQVQIEEDLKFLSNITTCIRTYSSSGIHAIVTETAKKYKLSVHQGIFLGDDPKVNEDEINSAKALADKNLIDSVIVGNETLLLKKMPKDRLIEYIHQVKWLMPSGIPVTTADGWAQWQDNRDLADTVDYILVHIHPFWDDKPIEGAASYVLETYQQLKKNCNCSACVGGLGYGGASFECFCKGGKDGLLVLSGC